MSKNTVKSYIVSHFAGDQSFAWSFWINGIAFSFLMNIAIVTVAYTSLRLNINGPAEYLVDWLAGAFYLCCLTWSHTGNSRAAIKTLKADQSGFPKKLFAVIVIPAVLTAATFIGLLVVVLVLAVTDLV